MGPPLLSVVVPVYNGGPAIGENVAVIRDVVGRALGEDAIELVVVSDGSDDGTVERLSSEDLSHVRVLHYDRNLGKGYAVRLGSLAARGEWVGIVDSDLDLDPGSLPGFLDVARRDGLDFAIGSKRHPESVVHYPRSRRAASWCYQQLNRLLFGLQVRDTQVGLKVVSRSVVDEVMPLLLVKQFAFDLELLAVGHALGYRRVRELPIRLDYRFTGSAVGSRAVVRALWDTLAVFYRLRILRTYERKRRLLGTVERARGFRPGVTLVASRGDEPPGLDYPALASAASLDDAETDLVARLDHGSRPAGNWIETTVRYLADDAVVAVVCPAMAPLDGRVLESAGACVLESRLGGGSRRVRFVPGNLRFVRDFPGATIVGRRTELLEAQRQEISSDRLVSWLARRGGLVVYTPETIVTTPPPRAVAPVLRAVHRDARARGAIARETRGSSLGAATALSLAPLALAAAGLPLVARGAPWRPVGAALLTGYAGAVLGSAALGALRFRSLGTGLVAAPCLVAAQAAYVAGFVRGVARGRDGAASAERRGEAAVDQVGDDDVAG